MVNFSDIVSAKTTQSIPADVPYNPGHIAGFEIAFESEQPYVGPGSCDVKGRKVLMSKKIALAECTWRIPKINSYQYHLYIDLNGTIYVDNQVPVIKDNYIGTYHPLLLARNISRVYVNDVGRYMDYTVATFILIGYSGDGTPYAPNEGDRRRYLDGDEDRYQEYTGGGWSAVNGIRIGGTDSNGVFVSGAGCRQIYNPQATEISQEVIPGPSFRVLDFETGFTDQFGDSPGVTSNPQRTTVWSMFGGYGFGAPSNSGYIRYTDFIDFSNNVGYCGWATSAALNEPSVMRLSYADAGNLILLNLELGPEVVNLESSGGFGTFTVSKAITSNKDIFLGVIIDVSANIIYLIVNNTVQEHAISAITPSGSVTANYFQVNYDGFASRYWDDVCFSNGEEITTASFVQHYNHNVPWNTDYSAKDLILRPASGGAVNLSKSPTKHYAPVAGEESVGTYHGRGNNFSGWDAAGLAGATYSTSNPYTLDISSIVPVGTKAIQGVLLICTTTTAAQDACRAYAWDYDEGVFASAVSYGSHGMAAVVSKMPAMDYTYDYQQALVNAPIEIGSSRKIYIARDQNTNNSVRLYFIVKGYYV